MPTKLSVETTVDNTLENVWDAWNSQEHIVKWYFASHEWYCPEAKIDLRVGGKMFITLASKDSGMSFDLIGEYTDIQIDESVTYTLEDGRVVTTSFEEVIDGTRVTQEFDAEGTNSAEAQKQGWQLILNNFQKYAEKM